MQDDRLRILIVGAGEVGFHIARRLAVENKDVVVIDRSEAALRRVLDHIDVQTVEGSGASPRILIDAGIKKADIFLAVTDSDEVNLIACFLASSLAPDILKLARIRNEEYHDFQDTLSQSIHRLGAVINPDAEVVNSILRLMSAPGAIEINEFAEGKVQLIGVRPPDDNPAAGRRLMDIRGMAPDLPFIVGALVRQDRLIIPGGEDTVEPGDAVYFACGCEDRKAVLELFGIKPEPLREILIIGGGNIGQRLARQLEEGPYHVRLIDKSEERCNRLSESLNKTIVLHGDGADQQLLQEENVHGMDLVAAVTGNEESNILSCLLAKRLGAKRAVTRINKFEYMPLVQAIGIDNLVCPRLSAINSILRYIRRGNVVSAQSIKGEDAEAIEAIVDSSSELAGQRIMDVKLPRGILILSIIRNGAVVLPTGDTVIDAQDRLLFLSTRGNISKVEKKLSVNLDFF
ncbi:MAG: Trk system potassium transporter TrkA [Desulfovibrionaceae bacterium]